MGATSAMADPGQFGKNLGDQVKSLSTGLFLAVAEQCDDDAAAFAPLA